MRLKVVLELLLGLLLALANPSVVGSQSGGPPADSEDPSMCQRAGALPIDWYCWTGIGYSQGGRPLVVHRLGVGFSRVLVLGGQHGGPESNTIELAGDLLTYLGSRPEQVPAGVGLDIIVVANPDGAETGSRKFLSGVDPNRNWGTADWRAGAWDSNGIFYPSLGGPKPFSEPETRALRDWVLERRPALVVNYHSVGGFMFGGRDGPSGDLTQAYAGASGYYTPQPNGPRLLGYQVTGSMGAWLREQGLASIFVELSTTDDPEFERNLAGLRAVLARLASA